MGRCVSIRLASPFVSLWFTHPVSIPFIPPLHIHPHLRYSRSIYNSKYVFALSSNMALYRNHRVELTKIRTTDVCTQVTQTHATHGNRVKTSRVALHSRIFSEHMKESASDALILTRALGVKVGLQTMRMTWMRANQAHRTVLSHNLRPSQLKRLAGVLTAHSRLPQHAHHRAHTQVIATK